MREKELCMLQRILEKADTKTKEIIKSATTSFVTFLVTVCFILSTVMLSKREGKLIKNHETSFKKL